MDLGHRLNIPTTQSISILLFAPAPPSGENWLGTDDQGQDVLARLIYGLEFRLIRPSLTIFSSLIGIAAGAVRGYFGGWTDLLFQRFIEI